jgi:hypothetical protein
MPSHATAEKDSAAGVTPSAPWRVKAISVLPDYRLAVTFNDDTSAPFNSRAMPMGTVVLLQMALTGALLYNFPKKTAWSQFAPTPKVHGHASPRP